MRPEQGIGCSPQTRNKQRQQGEIEMENNGQAELSASNNTGGSSRSAGPQKEMGISMASAEKSVTTRNKQIGERPERPDGPVGLDVGTSSIVMAQNRDDLIDTVDQTNAFYTIPYNNFTKNTLLNKSEIPFIEMNEQFYVLGRAAEDFAVTFHRNTRRPMQQGLINPKEADSIPIIQAILNTLIQRPKMPGENICYSVPGEPMDATDTVVYHSSVIKAYLRSLGYTPMPINEGLAVIMAELAREEFTGIAISMGGGMCNVCLGYLSVPVISFSIPKGGDYIDRMAGTSVGEPATKVKIIKENELSLAAKPRNRVETALHIYYGDLINSLLNSWQGQLMATDRMPRMNRSIPLVLSGGTSMPEGFQELFAAALKNITLPVEISEVRVSEEPLTAVARGALIKALSEEQI